MGREEGPGYGRLGAGKYMEGRRAKNLGGRERESRWEGRRDQEMGGREGVSRWKGRRDQEMGGCDWVNGWKEGGTRIWKAGRR